mmetsp:Transcript_53061/g.116160  ORF Transcript_53061/g.116160 Transcript_53061/m.116160 type:complete len:100 (+) Transcript_53061:73-372(+)
MPWHMAALFFCALFFGGLSLLENERYHRERRDIVCICRQLRVGRSLTLSYDLQPLLGVYGCPCPRQFLFVELSSVCLLPSSSVWAVGRPKPEQQHRSNT